MRSSGERGEPGRFSRAHGGDAYGCCVPALTRFTSPHCPGPPRLTLVPAVSSEVIRNPLFDLIGERAIVENRRVGFKSNLGGATRFSAFRMERWGELASNSLRALVGELRLPSVNGHSENRGLGQSTPDSRREPEKGFAMSCCSRRIREFMLREDGPAAVEYAVMLALIAVASVSIVTNLGQTASKMFGEVRRVLRPRDGD